MMQFDTKPQSNLMQFDCQSYPDSVLKSYAMTKKHSVIIYGAEGVGKTHLARKYAEYLNMGRDFVVIRPTMEEVQTTLEELVTLNTPTCVCIENLDTGVIGVSYALLKFIEEPKDNIYVIVTARNLNKLPDTILSRCVTVGINLPTVQDIHLYCKMYRSTDYARLKDHIIFNCIKSFGDIETIMDMNADKIAYFDNISHMMDFNDSVANLTYKFLHYTDKSKLPIQILLRYLIKTSEDSVINWFTLNCSDDISLGRTSDWCAVSKLIFDCKYYKSKI